MDINLENIIKDNQENQDKKDKSSNTNDDTMNKVKKYIQHKPLKYGKKIYITEFLSEKFIKLTALVSILAIFAIFYYVFSEAKYAFQDNSKETSSFSNNSDPELETQSSDDGEDFTQTRYGSEPEKDESKELVQERYGSSTEAEKPEVTEELEPAKYGEENTTNQESDTEANVTANADESADLQEEESTSENVFEEMSLEEHAANSKKLSYKEFIFYNDWNEKQPRFIWQPISETPKYSFIPLLTGALKVTIIGLLFAAPLSILAALFTVAFAPKWLREVIKPAIEILAGFPSVVVGFFCLMTLATVIQNIFGTTFRLNAFVGGLGMAMAVIPIIFTITEDSMNAVPQYMKAASYALGASRWQTAWKVVLPAAAPGVFASLILGFGRAFGETMIALMATGNAALTSADLFESVRTLASTIGSEMAEVEFRGTHYGVLFLIGAVLFTITFALNALAEFYVRKKLIKKFQGD